MNNKYCKRVFPHTALLLVSVIIAFSLEVNRFLFGFSQVYFTIHFPQEELLCSTCHLGSNSGTLHQTVCILQKNTGKRPYCVMSTASGKECRILESTLEHENRRGFCNKKLFSLEIQATLSFASCFCNWRPVNLLENNLKRLSHTLLESSLQIKGKQLEHLSWLMMLSFVFLFSFLLRYYPAFVCLGSSSKQFCGWITLKQ